MFKLELGLACLITGALGLREAFRYRLLVSRAGRSTTLFSVLLVLGWIGVLVWSMISVGVVRGGAILAISFVVGNLVRIVFASISGCGILSPESSAEHQYESTLAAEMATRAVNAVSLRDVVRQYDLTPDDFQRLYFAARRHGLDRNVALRAMLNPNVIVWYFENVGKGGELSVDALVQFVLLAKGEISV